MVVHAAGTGVVVEGEVAAPVVSLLCAGMVAGLVSAMVEWKEEDR